jgi:hypothetical protein
MRIHRGLNRLGLVVGISMALIPTLIDIGNGRSSFDTAMHFLVISAVVWLAIVVVPTIFWLLRRWVRDGFREPYSASTSHEDDGPPRQEESIRP